MPTRSMSDPEVGSTNQADLHPVGTAASPMVVTRLKKPWLLRMYTPKRLLGCFIFQLIDGIALGILLISLKYGDGLIIALSPMQILAGTLGIISFRIKDKSGAQTAVLLLNGMLGRVVKALFISFLIKEMYWSVQDKLYGNLAYWSIFLLYVLILVVVDLTGVCQAVRYTAAVRRSQLRRLERLTDVMTFMAKREDWTLRNGRLVQVNPEDPDSQRLLDDECTSNATAPEA